MSEWRYATRDGHVLRWPRDDNVYASTNGESREAGSATSRPKGIELLTTRSWVPVGRLMAWFLWRGAKSAALGTVERRLVRACCPTGAAAASCRTWRLRSHTWLLLWLVNPPLPWGAPRMLADEERASDQQTPVDLAVASFAESLRRKSADDSPAAQSSFGSDLEVQARSGWERAAARLSGIESRAATFIQVAGLTTTVILVNNSLVTDDDKLKGASRTFFIVALMCASVCLLIAGLYGLIAVMRTFGRIAPDNERRIIRRAQTLEEGLRATETLAALLLAQRRTSIIADWKLARLKRATLAFAVAALAIAAASGAYVTGASGP